MKKAFIFILVACLLCGCENISSNLAQMETEKSSNITSPDLTRYGNENNMNYEAFWYVVDNRTGVVYLEYNSGRRYGITVMLNADGTPVTQDQLKLED